ARSAGPRRDIFPTGRWRFRACRTISWRSLFDLFHHVDGVFRDLDGEIAVLDDRLAGQPRIRLQSPGLVEQFVLFFLRTIQRLEALAHDHVTGGAGAGFLAGVLDLDAVLEQVVADGLARLGLDDGAAGTELFVREDGDARHQARGSRPSCPRAPA